MADAAMAAPQKVPLPTGGKTLLHFGPWLPPRHRLQLPSQPLVSRHLKIFLFRDKYYLLTCSLCLERRFSSLQGLYVHVNQSDPNHSSLIASDHSWAGALRAVATHVVDANAQNVELHNQVGLDPQRH
ncbi:hypothetical protein LARI1_G001869 [Lachnellula arida]|uniref:Uncharacterized protein n=1 Tax=Lachnellula arida TaxID=1316785 RepID=A0A8T9BK43_9HELO|nr:hypothetical protein LARI1_G001869 [Lachnellula arida]